MRALFIIAHGSRVKASNKEVLTLVDKVKVQSSQYDLVSCGFLELAQPNINQGISDLAKKGATSIFVLPYFLVAGNHVLNDIPAAVEVARKSFPRIDMTIAPYFGTAPEIAELLVSQVT